MRAVYAANLVSIDTLTSNKNGISVNLTTSDTAIGSFYNLKSILSINLAKFINKNELTSVAMA